MICSTDQLQWWVGDDIEASTLIWLLLTLYSCTSESPGNHSTHKVATTCTCTSVSVKSGLWTLDWTRGLDCGLRFVLDFGMMSIVQSPGFTLTLVLALSCAHAMQPRYSEILLVLSPDPPSK